MSQIKATFSFTVNREIPLVSNVSDSAEIDRFTFLDVADNDIVKFLEVGSQFRFEEKLYEIEQIHIGLVKLPYKEAPKHQIGSEATADIYFYVKEVV